MSIKQWFLKLFGKLRKNKKDVKDAEKNENTASDSGNNQTQQNDQPIAQSGSFNLKIPVFIEIKESDGQYTGWIHQGIQNEGYHIPVLNLAQNLKPLKDNDWTLDDLIKAIIEFNPNDLKAFDERVQLNLGQHLYNQTLGTLPEQKQEQLSNAKDLRILTNDEWIAKLPWNLLANKGIFLCTIGYSVSVSRQSENAPCELPPSPRLLIVAPQPANVPETYAKDHLEDLEDILSSHDPLLSFDNHIKTACTWDDFVCMVNEFKPQLVYYYGHGESEGKKTRLVFAQGPKNKRLDKPVADFALCLRNMEKPPILAYINCCLGDAGGFLGAGMQLGDFIPAVITNRTIAYIPVAQAQGIALWENILIRAIPPHQAVATLYARMEAHNLTTADIKWINPVFHCHYSQWDAKPPTPPDRLTDDPHWHLKIDRVSQFSHVVAQTRLMLREKKPKSLVFVWYGQEGQGIEIFHKRLWVELREDLSNTFVHPVRPAWPFHLEDYQTAFGNTLAQAFEVNTLDDIPARIRNESHGQSGRQTLVYIRHEPVRATNLINPESLRGYVEWWDHEFAPRLQKSQFALLSVSFIVENPPAFAEYMEEEKFDSLDLKHTDFWLLDEMEQLALKDLLRFLRTHNIRLPVERRDKVLKKILKKTGGQYEQTIDELKKLRKEAWQVDEKDAAEKKTEKKIFKY
ncbi:MAG: hypothetical protein GY749_05905 [Desulfobacteraceae bacterium]|nr:hypothetical protein [Desulfobacteraceae bacterium]